MPWYAWLATAFGLVLFAGVAATVALRHTARGRRFWNLSSRAKLRFGRLLLASSGTPFVARLALLVLTGYLLLPFDLIPDFIPVLGQADDALAIAAVALLLLVIVPPAQWHAALTQAEAEDIERRKKTPS